MKMAWARREPPGGNSGWLPIYLNYINFAAFLTYFFFFFFYQFAILLSFNPDCHSYCNTPKSFRRIHFEFLNHFL